MFYSTKRKLLIPKFRKQFLEQKSNYTLIVAFSSLFDTIKFDSKKTI